MLLEASLCQSLTHFMHASSPYCTFLCSLCHHYIIYPPSPLPTPSLSLLFFLFRAREQRDIKTKMDVYGVSTTAPDYFRIDDLLDLSNDNLFSSSIATTMDHHLHPPPPPPPENPSFHHFPSSSPFDSSLSSDFTDHLSVPSDDVAELEWLSQFVDDSFADYPASSFSGTINIQSASSFSFKSSTKQSRGMAGNANTAWTSPSSPDSQSSAVGKPRIKKEINRVSSPTADGVMRRCTHCASEKTPQWRTGPLGPKTLCNACGVRYKSGRLVPEYRPAASPTFVLTQHSNSHRKVLELRRQKEMMRQQQVQGQQQQHTIFHHHHQQDFEVC